MLSTFEVTKPSGTHYACARHACFRLEFCIALQGRHWLMAKALLYAPAVPLRGLQEGLRSDT